jgi:DegV family protein with EDD domain
MTRTCILTDETAQFLDLSFNGQECVHLMPLEVRGLERERANGGKPKVSQFPESRYGALSPSVSLPSVADFQHTFANLARQYDEMVVVLPPSWLTGNLEIASKAAANGAAGMKIEIIDSDSFGIGLGYLVKKAAEQAAAGANAVAIKRRLKGLIPQVYSVFCLRNFSYLEALELLTKPQAIIADMLGISQIFYNNMSQLVPVQKVRNARHFVESIQEFVSEFEDPAHIAFLQNGHSYQQEIRTLRERFLLECPNVLLTEHTLSAPLAALLGPQAFGLFLWENET